MAAYDQYNAGNLVNYELQDSTIHESIDKLEKLIWNYKNQKSKGGIIETAPFFIQRPGLRPK